MKVISKKIHGRDIALDVMSRRDRKIKKRFGQLPEGVQLRARMCEPGQRNEWAQYCPMVRTTGGYKRADALTVAAEAIRKAGASRG